MKRRAHDLTEPGWFIAAAMAILLTMGLACIYTTDTHYVAGNDGPGNAAKQLALACVGAVAAYAVLYVGFHEVARHAYLIFGICLVLLIPPVVAHLTQSTLGGLAAPRNGAYRWLHLPGYQLQPSELMKVGFLLALAWYLRYRKNYRNIDGLLMPFAISIVPFGLILLEPDLGTVLLLICVLFGMMFMAGAKIKHLLMVALFGVVMLPVAWGHIKDYQRLRVSSVLLQIPSLRQDVIDHPEKYQSLATKRQAMEWAASSGYQLVHSKNAIGSGGLIGQGFGNGVYVNSSLLPDRHNDFVFSLIGHQWGLLGCGIVLICYTVIALSGVRIASATTDPFGRLIAVGVVTLLISQVLINIGMTIGLLPITGMTLPFVSYGGSSLLSNFVAAALLISVSQRRPFLLADKPFDYARRMDRTTLVEHRHLDE